MTDNELTVYDLVSKFTVMVQLMKAEDDSLQDLSDTVTAIALLFFNNASYENEKGDNTKVMDEKPMTIEEKAEQLRRIFGKEILNEINERIKADNDRYLKEHGG